MPITIRKATIADLNAIIEIENSSFDSDRFSRRQFFHLIKHAKGIFYVAESDKCILGYLSLIYRTNSKCLRIYSIAVSPEARGQQIGQQFIDKSKEYATTYHLLKISLEVRTDNRIAINLYKKNGFEVTSIIKEYYSDGSDALRMNLLI